MYKFDVDAELSRRTRTPNALRGRRAADLDYCGYSVECADEAAKDAPVNKCCKTCQIDGYAYRLDVGTFARTRPHGTKKDPLPLWKYCGLQIGKVWGHNQPKHVYVYCFQCIA